MHGHRSDPSFGERGSRLPTSKTEPGSACCRDDDGLLIEWFGTFDGSIGEKGFNLRE